jgi:hypothetical protein
LTGQTGFGRAGGLGLALAESLAFFAAPSELFAFAVEDCAETGVATDMLPATRMLAANPSRRIEAIVCVMVGA